MDRSVLLAIDQGTTSSRAILYHSDGTMIGSHQVSFATQYPEDGWVEQDPEAIWSSVLTCIQTVFKKNPDALARCVGVGLSNQRETTIVWRKDTGEAVYPAIVWQDRRTAKQCAEWSADQALSKLVLQETGLLLDPYFCASKIAWILDTVSGVRALAEQGLLLFGTVDTYLLWRFSRGQRHQIDVTNASRTLLFDLASMSWHQELLSFFNIPESILPTITDSAGSLGVIDSSFCGRELPITGVLGDQQAALFGQACFHSGMAKCTYGTGSFLLVNTGDQRIHSKNRLISTVAYRFKGAYAYGLEGSHFIAGAAIQWMQESVGFIEEASDCSRLPETVSDNGGVYMVPAFTGLGAPYWDPEARGALFGLKRDTQLAHIVRAAIEGIAYQTKDLWDAMEADGVPPLSILRVDGGMTVNTWFLQFLSDILDVQLARPADVEVSAWGVACMAGWGAGFYSGLSEIESLWTADRLESPSMPQETRQRLYAGWQAAIRRVCS